MSGRKVMVQPIVSHSIVWIRKQLISSPYHLFPDPNRRLYPHENMSGNVVIGLITEHHLQASANCKENAFRVFLLSYMR